MEVVFRRTVKNLARITKLDTQKLRKNAIKSLEESAKIANDSAPNPRGTEPDKGRWTRLETHTRQTIIGVLDDVNVRSYTSVLGDFRTVWGCVVGG